MNKRLPEPNANRPAKRVKTANLYGYTKTETGRSKPNRHYAAAYPFRNSCAGAKHTAGTWG
ncbi:MAG TPA: hypothetical protein VN038_18035 [Dyadobacter sp.]|nr:hypothetical protein [Dyadobacter sp.]